MLTDVLSTALVVGLLSGMIRMATPIIFAALGELIVERAGVLNLSIEGMMTVGAYTGFFVASRTGSLWAGVFAAMIAGGVFGALLAFLVAVLKADQTISGLSLNILASGLALYAFRVAFKVSGQNLPTVQTFADVRLPILSRIPIMGEAFFAQPLLTYAAFLLIPALLFFLYRTTYGLVLRCIGENPVAVDMKGVNVVRYRFLAIVFGGVLAGVGGSFLTLASAGLYMTGIVGGRGWITLAIVILGNWRAQSIFLAALLFGFLDAFQLQLQGLGIAFPYQVLGALPYVLTIAVLVVGRQKGGGPLALGVPYVRD